MSLNILPLLYMSLFGPQIIYCFLSLFPVKNKFEDLINRLKNKLADYLEMKSDKSKVLERNVLFRTVIRVKITCLPRIIPRKLTIQHVQNIS